MKIDKRPRTFLPQDFILTTWESVAPYFQKLTEAPLDSLQKLHLWLAQKSELESVLEEDMGWRYIRMTCDTANEGHRLAYEYFISEIDPKIQPISHALDEKLLACPFTASLQSTEELLMLRRLEIHKIIFREENIPISTQIAQEQVKYGSTVGGMQVTIRGEEMTLPKASTLLMNPDRALRQEAYQAIQEVRISKKDFLDNLMNTLVQLRHQIGINAGFDGYKNYMFQELCRFDYDAHACENFHESIAQTIMPIIRQLAESRKTALKVNSLKPYDLSVDVTGQDGLKPFTDGADLVQKTIACFDRLDPFFGDCIRTLQSMQHLDVESRKGKAPGGYNYPLYESGVPFIFMNASSSLRDLVTMVHEGGHAIHSILTKDLAYTAYLNLPSEVAELASMGMELLSMEHWDVFFSNPEDLKRAKKEHLEQIIETLPWVATIDQYQHWLYDHPTHTIEERTEAWIHIYERFANPWVDWKGYESYKANIWQKQLHIFEVPFYYIEYGIAQLGAIALWKNYKENPKQTLDQYKAALSLGYTRSIPEIYTAAGISFDFTASRIGILMAFVKEEMEKLG